MTIAVMQPYIFPYLGYYQLVHAVDKFIFFNDVNFINKGWINRNQILQQNEPYRFTVPLIKASQNRMINEIELADYDKWRKDFLKQIEFNYKKAPQFVDFFGRLQDFLFSREYNLISDLAADSIKMVSDLLQIEVQFDYSGNLNYRDETTDNGQEKILNICAMLGADQYINPKNGTGLYNPELFESKNIKLNFICMDDINYQQFQVEKFVPYLSIIDVLMFNDLEKVNYFLNRYTLN